MDSSITYEQPLNEQMRICLRLEHLFNQLKDHIGDTTTSGSRIAMSALLKTLNVIDRPDLKSKLNQMLTQQATTLAQLEHADNVDSTKLSTVLAKLDRLIDALHKTEHKIGHRLRGNAFLNQIRAQLNNPAGPNNFSAPAFALWLRQPSEVRTRDLSIWASEFEQLGTTVQTLLHLTRDSSPSQTRLAKSGFYQQALDPSLPCQMIRVTVPMAKSTYPEISVGKHRLVIRFLQPHYLGEQASQLNEPLTFELSCCRA